MDDAAAVNRRPPIKAALQVRSRDPAALISSLTALILLRPPFVFLILVGSILGVVGLWIASRPE